MTPLQLARAIGGLAIGGVWHRPHLTAAGSKTDKPISWTLKPQNLKDVIDGMYGVVNEGGGTGVRAQLPNIEVCGKTGTAQVASNEYVKGKGSDKNLKDNAWFVGFAPRQAPEIVIAALFEHGAESKLAAPIVRDVMKAYFDKKTRLAALAGPGAGLATLAGPGATPLHGAGGREKGLGAEIGGAESLPALQAELSPPDPELPHPDPDPPPQPAPPAPAPDPEPGPDVWPTLPGEPLTAAPPEDPDLPLTSEAPAPGPPLRATERPPAPVWLLSLFTPANADSVDWRRGNYAVLARSGRIDSPAGSGDLTKQIQMVVEGSVLYAEGAPHGSAADVAPDGFAHPVFRAGFALAIPLPEAG